MCRGRQRPQKLRLPLPATITIILTITTTTIRTTTITITGMTTITVTTTGAVNIQRGSTQRGIIDVSGNVRGGTINIIAGGSISVAGEVLSNNLPTSGGNGIITLRSGGDVTSGNPSTISAQGGEFSTGGFIDITAAGRVDMGTLLSVDGGDGGVIDISSGGESIIRGIRAVGQNPNAAKLIGIDVSRLFIVTFALSAALAGLTGVLLGSVRMVTPAFGSEPLVKALIIVIFGGLGSLGGTILAAYLIGLLEAALVFFIGIYWAPSMIFVLLIVILLLRPQGLLGKAMR